MAKIDEIQYAENMAAALNVTQETVSKHLLEKPFGESLRGCYFTDMGQLMGLLPPPPARILDLGVGVGWTSRFLFQCGYSVVGLDIAPTMVRYAKEAAGAESDRLSFHVCDYETPFDFGQFDAVVIYDALHHAEDEASVIQNAHAALKPGGIFITLEPGRGHSLQTHSTDAMQKFGVTEKDMEFNLQRRHMQAIGFSDIRQFVRFSQLALKDLAKDKGAEQTKYLKGLVENTVYRGSSSIVVAVK
jgi:SAM-dependent methyltransferase